MKKNLLLIVGIAFLAMYACTSDIESSQNKEISNFNGKNNQPIFASIAGGQGGAFGVGIEGAEYIPMGEGCQFVQANCYAIPMFEGGGEPNVSIDLLRKDKMRIHFLSKIPKVSPEELVKLEYLRGFDLERMANFMNTHYNIPTLNRIDDRINRKIIESYGLERESVVYILPKKYKRIVSRENPYGYIDVDIHIHPNGEELPAPLNPLCSTGCTYVWIGYINNTTGSPWGCKCY